MRLSSLYNRGTTVKDQPAFMVQARSVLLGSALALGALGLGGCTSVSNVIQPMLPDSMKSAPKVTTEQDAANELAKYDPTAQRLDPPRNLNRFLAKADGQCAPVTGPGPNDYANGKVHDIYSILSMSAIDRDQWANAAQYKTGPAWICFNKNMRGHGAYYNGEGVLVLNDRSTMAAQIAATSHELAHLTQELEGLTPYALRNVLDEEGLLHLFFAQEASAEALSVQALWEMKESGFPGPWQGHNTFQGCRSTPGICYKSVSDAFARVAKDDPDNVTNGAAMRAAVYAWYDHPVTVSTYRSMFFRDSGFAPFKASKIPGYADNEILGRLGEVPTYRINFIEDAGGLRNILLQESPRKAAFPSYKP